MIPQSNNDSSTSVRQWLFIFWAIHIFFWTLLPTLLQHNAPLDVIEGLAWGQQWAWGYDKHPWLAPWLTELASLLGGHAVWTIYLLSQLAIVLCFWATWRLARDLLPARHAVAAVLVLEGIFYYNFTSVEFNPNVAMLPLWALSILTLHRALKLQGILTWILVGIFAGLAMMTKYFSALLMLCQLLFLISEPDARRSFKRAGPYLALLVFLLVITPNLVWLAKHNFISLHYAMNRTNAITRLWWHHLIYPIQFSLSQFLAVLPALIIFLPCLRGEKSLLSLSVFDRRFLYWMGIGPFLLVILLSLFGGIELRSMYGTPLFSLLGVLLIIQICPALTTQQFHAVWRNTIIVFILFLVAFIASTIGKPYLLGDAKRINFPGPEIALQVTQQWRHQYQMPLKYVAGDRWLAGNVAFYSPDHPIAYFDWDPTISFWIDEQRLRRDGAIFIWDVQEQGKLLPAKIAARFPQAITLPIQYFASPIAPHKVPPVIIGVAFLPPQNSRPNFTIINGVVE
ncbi:MAG: glycosyltransferase family 39 protein [Gammaproteobacteria bacterium]